MEKLVIIPTFNEKENISSILHAIFNLGEGFHILVIDDGSPDGTAAIVKELQSKFSGQLFIEERTGKLGLGTAYIHGFKWAIEKDYQYSYTGVKNSIYALYKSNNFHINSNNQNNTSISNFSNNSKIQNSTEMKIFKPVVKKNYI